MSGEIIIKSISSVKNYLRNCSRRDRIRAARWLIGLVLLGAGLTLLIQDGFWNTVKGIFFIVVSLTCLVRKLSYFLSKIYKKILHRIRIKKAGLSYRYVEQLIKDEDYQTAEEELYWIIENFPNEVKPHIFLVELALKFHKDQNIADMRMLHALRTFKKDEDQEKLKRGYNKLSPRNREHISFKKEKTATPRPKLKPLKTHKPSKS